MALFQRKEMIPSELGFLKFLVFSRQTAWDGSSSCHMLSSGLHQSQKYFPTRFFFRFKADVIDKLLINNNFVTGFVHFIDLKKI